jgi:predicted esterase
MSLIVNPNDEYPTPFTIHPSSPSHHNNTVILLHGTSMTGPELASTLLAFPFPFPSTTSPPTTLQRLFPTTRFVFPTGKERTTTVFRGRVTNAWFDIHAFHDRTIGETFAAEGIKQSLSFLYSLIVLEIAVLDSKPESRGGGIVIGGFSQGCALGICLLISGILNREVMGGRMKGFVGMSGWMPFRAQIQQGIQDRVVLDDETRRETACRVLHDILGDKEDSMVTIDMPMYFTHGEMDEKVKMEWSKQMTGVLSALGAEKVERVEMDGVGHWYGVEGMVGLVVFLQQTFSKKPISA